MAKILVTGLPAFILRQPAACGHHNEGREAFRYG